MAHATAQTRTECLSLAGETIAVQFGLVHERVYSMLLVGLDAVRHGRLSPGLLVIEDSIRSAVEAGDRVYDFTIGDHPYKLQFGATMVPLEEWQSRAHLARIRGACCAHRSCEKQSAISSRCSNAKPQRAKTALDRRVTLNQATRNAVNRALFTLQMMAPRKAGL